MSLKGVPRTKHVLLGKHTLETYSIGFLASATDLAQVTLRLWERQGILPKPVLKLPGGMRFYTALEITKYASLISDHYTSGRDLKLLKQRLALASVELRGRLQSISQMHTAPVEALRLHISPKPRWQHEIEKAA